MLTYEMESWKKSPQVRKPKCRQWEFYGIDLLQDRFVSARSRDRDRDMTEPRREIARLQL